MSQSEVLGIEVNIRRLGYVIWCVKARGYAQDLLHAIHWRFALQVCDFEAP